MAKGYRRVDRGQAFLLPPSMMDWLPEEHLVWFVIEAMERLDTAAFHVKGRLGGVGRRGYDPDMLLALLVYAMAGGERSSRKIECLCRTDVAFRVICAQDVPDHTVVARFRRDHEAALEDLLTKVLALCAELGMARFGVVAFDGTKIAANAARAGNRTGRHLRRLAREHLEQTAVTDDAEDRLFGGQGRGDEMPEAVKDRTRRGARIRQALAVVEECEAAEVVQAEQRQAAAEVYTQKVGEATGAQPGRTPKDADPVAVATARWEREYARAKSRCEDYQVRADAAAASGGKLPGTPPAPPDAHPQVSRLRVILDDALAAQAEEQAEEQAEDNSNDGAGEGSGGDGQPPKANLTDPDSRLLKTHNGWVQGYNCQTAVSDDGFIVSARATQDANDINQFEPTVADVTAAARNLAGHVPERRDKPTVGTLVGDAGYDSNDNLNAHGPDRLIANSKRRDLTRRAITDPVTGEPPKDATARQKMDHRLRTPDGHALYKRRAPLVEAPNAWLKDGRGLRRGFSRRGLAAAQSELSFAAAVTNLLRLFTNGITTTHLATT